MGEARHSNNPATFGRYETLFRIAAGGMAEVYAARVRGEAGFQKLVALKRMLPHLTDDERFVTMFMDEGKLAANIESPNVVSTLDLGRADDGSLYLVMELVVGTTLSTLLRNAAKTGSSIPPDVACEILAQAAQGLHDAHEARTPFGAPLQLVHRDISPQNILVGVDGRVRITDFGVARAVLRRTKTSTGEFKGKLSYFSPEQCADRDVDRRSDIFSLGVVAWETLTTRRLFHAENPLAVLERVTRMPIPSAHEVNAQIPVPIASVVASALARNRESRHQTAADLARALRGAARDAYGATDRSKIADLVQTHGGDTLERIQSQLKESLSNPGTFIEQESVLEDPTEISSGIVVRHDEQGPATPRAPGEASGSMPRFEYAPDSHRTAHPRPKPSRAPLYVALLVALLGLGGGATIGVLAMQGDDREAPVVLPSEADEPMPAPPDDTSVAAVDETEEADEPDDAPAAEPEEPTEPEEAAPAAAEPRRGRRSARRDPRPTSLQPRVQPLSETHPAPTTPRPTPPPTTTRRSAPPTTPSDDDNGVMWRQWGN